ncbi:HalOD1 output domain-containing protein [Natrinema marinum]|uniref:HalOD1 output domain-containing protein n=1 Tax=Natrinema marinum TaxID=2961598 RepID=UPI0020C851EF|nr:HalOD1 output domain-containing protein [Natrinema marinum]
MTGSDRDPTEDRPILAERTYDESTPASIAAIYALATALETDPISCSTEFGFTLYDYVDPEALNAIVTHDQPAGTVTVELSLEEYLLQITDTGRVRVLGASDSLPEPDR